VETYKLKQSADATKLNKPVTGDKPPALLSTYK